MKKIFSRKLLITLLATGMFLIHPQEFTGWNLVLIYVFYVSSNVFQKIFTKGQIPNGQQ